MAGKYKVTVVYDRVRPKAQGGFEDVVEIRYETQHGYIGTLSIPKSELTGKTPEQTQAHIRKALETEVDKVEGIYQLGQ